MLPDESGNPDKPIGTYQKEAMHAPCNTLETPFHGRFKGLFFRVAPLDLPPPRSFKSLPPLRGVGKAQPSRWGETAVRLHAAAGGPQSRLPAHRNAQHQAVLGRVVVRRLAPGACELQGEVRPDPPARAPLIPGFWGQPAE